MKKKIIVKNGVVVIKWIRNLCAQYTVIMFKYGYIEICMKVIHRQAFHVYTFESDVAKTAGMLLSFISTK